MVSGPKFSSLFMVRVRVRVIFDCDLTFICVHRYGEKINEDANHVQFGLGPKKTLQCNVSNFFLLTGSMPFLEGQ